MGEGVEAFVTGDLAEEREEADLRIRRDDGVEVLLCLGVGATELVVR